MHMADALISPEIGGLLWLVSGAALVRSARAVAAEPGGARTPLTGVLGAFVFAVQMLNFAIPGTGSSGHLGGAMLLAVLLGPHAALLTMASVLVVQAFFFADGGLLALGCNIFNLGVLPVFLAYPLVYRPLAGAQGRRRGPAAFAAAVAGLALGAVAVALETRFSGISALPLRAFLMALVPIHLAIGLVEGAATLALLRFLAQARPELFHGPRTSWRAVTLVAVLALAAGGVLSWAASRNPDGLEWAVAKVAGTLPSAGGTVHAGLDRAQKGAALLPEYGFRDRGAAEPTRLETSLSGVVGGALTLALVAGAALLLKRRRSA